MREEILEKETICDGLVNDKEYTALPKYLREDVGMIKLLNSKFNLEKSIATVIADEYSKNVGIIDKDFKGDGKAYRCLGRTETILEYFEDKDNGDFLEYFSNKYDEDYMEYLFLIELVEDYKGMLENEKVESTKGSLLLHAQNYFNCWKEGGENGKEKINDYISDNNLSDELWGTLERLCSEKSEQAVKHILIWLEAELMEHIPEDVDTIMDYSGIEAFARRMEFYYNELSRIDSICVLEEECLEYLKDERRPKNWVKTPENSFRTNSINNEIENMEDGLLKLKCEWTEMTSCKYPYIVFKKSFMPFSAYLQEMDGSQAGKETHYECTDSSLINPIWTFEDEYASLDNQDTSKQKNEVNHSKRIFDKKQLEKMISQKNIDVAKDNPTLRMGS